MPLIPPRWKCWLTWHIYATDIVVHKPESRTVEEILYICARCGHEKHHKLDP